MGYDVNRIEFAKTQKTKYVIKTIKHIFQICIDFIAHIVQKLFLGVAPTSLSLFPSIHPSVYLLCTVPHKKTNHVKPSKTEILWFLVILTEI